MGKIQNLPRINLPASFLERVVNSIIGAVPTESIYVFGSYARGEENSNSDVDIYIVTSDETARPLVCAGKARQALLWMPLKRDVLAAPRSLFDRRSKDFWKVEARVMEDGVKIYG